MKKNVLNIMLASAAATALIAGAGLASAQTMNSEQPKASAPLKSDSEKAGQRAQSPNKDAAQTTGQAPKADDAKKAEDGKKTQGAKPQTTGQAPKADDAKKADDTKKARQTTGQAPRDGQPQPQQAQPGAQPGQSGTQSDTRQGQPGQANGGAQQPGAQPGQSGTQSSTQGKADGGAQAQLSTEQRTQIRQTVMRMGDAPRVSSVPFSLSVGTVVPRTVKYAPLPSRVVEIYPAWRSYHFFLVGDQIVIVEPDTLRIVAVIPA
jgi:hypothetical protein